MNPHRDAVETVEERCREVAAEIAALRAEARALDETRTPLRVPATLAVVLVFVCVALWVLPTRFGTAPPEPPTSIATTGAPLFEAAVTSITPDEGARGWKLAVFASPVDPGFCVVQLSNEASTVTTSPVALCSRSSRGTVVVQSLSDDEASTHVALDSTAGTAEISLPTKTGRRTQTIRFAPRPAASP